MWRQAWSETGRPKCSSRLLSRKQPWAVLNTTPLCHLLLQPKQNFPSQSVLLLWSLIKPSRELKIINEGRKTLRNGEFHPLPTLFFELKMFKLKNTRSTWCLRNLRSASGIWLLSIPVASCLMQCSVRCWALGVLFPMQSEVLSRIERPLLFPLSLGYLLIAGLFT